MQCWRSYINLVMKIYNQRFVYPFFNGLCRSHTKICRHLFKCVMILEAILCKSMAGRSSSTKGKNFLIHLCPLAFLLYFSLIHSVLHVCRQWIWRVEAALAIHILLVSVFTDVSDHVLQVSNFTMLHS